ncbi:hypothetical protein BDQ12DRAFT_689665 [Crucibulum laeve]|uniref:NADH dehydrogenase [ubiquinone] 1 alpha subcomplex subunit n=1 Tax=Crucibulum laeve TaxID=68775 RepID=A0A5C3M0E5_9AGAR|nr:hypothetical protein BDQ12DRAFT_689665 [Crucibulum laeve]
MSIISRIWNAVRNPVRYVGRDLEGNRFYEAPSSTDDPRRTKRTIQYRDQEEVWKYIGGGKRLPIQWSSWLTHTRPYPPSLEELQADLARQHRVLMNAAMIEARDEEERKQALQLRNADRERLQAPPPEPIQAQVKLEALSTHDAEALPSPPPPNAQLESAKEQEQPKSPWKHNIDPEPESWTPRARRRGQ